MNDGLGEDSSLACLLDMDALRKFSEMMLEAVFIVINGGIAYCNKAGTELTGVKNSAEIKGRIIKEFIHPDYLEDFTKTRDTFIKKGEEGFRIETRIVRVDGVEVDIEASAKEFWKNGKHVTCVIIKNITDNKRTKKLLNTSEEKYKALIGMLPDSVILRDDEKILYANMAAIQTLGCERLEDVVGRGIMEFVTPYPIGKVTEDNFKHEISKKKYIPFREIQYIRKSDGAVLMTETAVKSIPNQEEPIYMVVVRDLSERKRNEELKKDIEEQTRKLGEAVEYERLRTEFFANLSHEFRTPLNVILSALQLSRKVLKELPLADNREKIIKCHDLVQQNCYRLIRMVNNLIDITSIDTGFLNIIPEKCDIVSIVEDITLSVKSYIENKGICLTFDTDEEEIYMLCDQEKIERIMLNLLSNALKFTDPGGSITVSVKKMDKVVFISIKDTGIGILEDKKPLVFERFWRVDKSLSRNNEGSGIGLALVKSLVEMHGGNIRLNSVYKEGSEFIIELPITNAPENKIVNRSSFFKTDNLEKISIEFSDIYF